jgi:hypothetical protein
VCVVVQDEHIVNRAESVVELHPERSEIAGTVVLEVRGGQQIRASKDDARRALKQLEEL